MEATGIVCGTGFVKSAFSLPLLRRLAQTYDVPVHQRAHPAEDQLRGAPARPRRLAALP